VKRPLAAALLFFTAGTLAGLYSTDPGAVFLCTAVCLAAFAVCRVYKQYLYMFFALAALAGFISAAVRARDAGLDAYAAYEKSFTFYAGAEHVSATKTKRPRVEARVYRLADGQNTYDKNFKMLVYFDESVRVEPGSNIVFTGSLMLPDRRRNPGGFDEYAFLSARKLQYKTFATLVDMKERFNVHSVLGRVSAKLASVYDRTLPAREAGIIKSIIIGDRSGLDAYTGELFRFAGIYHILAISGLHISVVALIINFLLRKILPRRAAGVICMSALTLYCLMTGANPATVRAVFMCGVVVAGGMFEKPPDLTTSTAFTCLCLLLFEPNLIMDVGFIYSFGSLFSICLLTGPFKRFYMTFIKKPGPADALSASTAVFAGTLPVSVNLVYYVLPYSILVNLLVLPTMFFLLITGVAAGAAGLFSYNAALFLSGGVFFTLRVYAAICEFFTALPGSAILTGHMDVYATAFYYGLLILFIKLFSCFGEQFKRYKKIFFVASAIFIIVAAARRYYPAGVTYACLDVGQGDASVLHKNNRAVVIDGGGQPGSAVLIPYFDYMALKKADAVFVSHFDTDHTAGVLELIEKKRAKTVFVTRPYAEDSSYADFMAACEKSGVNPVLISAGDAVTIDKDLIIYCLHPGAGYDPNGSNDASLVLKAVYKNHTFLFTGDVGFSAERALIDSGADISADILKLAHHGSKNSTSEAFLVQSNPLAAICGSGRRNSYGHPAAETLERLEKFGVSFYNTADNGAIFVMAKNNGYTIRTMLD